MGAVNVSAVSFVRAIGRLISNVAGDRRTTQILFLSLQWYDAITFQGSFKIFL